MFPFAKITYSKPFFQIYNQEIPLTLEGESGFIIMKAEKKISELISKSAEKFLDLFLASIFFCSPAEGLHPSLRQCLRHETKVHLILRFQSRGLWAMSSTR